MQYRISTSRIMYEGFFFLEVVFPVRSKGPSVIERRCNYFPKLYHFRFSAISMETRIFRKGWKVITQRTNNLFRDSPNRNTTKRYRRCERNSVESTAVELYELGWKLRLLSLHFLEYLSRNSLVPLSLAGK